MKRSGSSSRVVRRVVAGVAIVVLVASCGSDDGSSSTAATSVPSDDVCEDREALRSSVDDLEGIDLRAEGAEGVTDDLTALRDSAGDELRPEVQAVQDAVDELETAVGNLGSGGAADAVTAASDLVSTAGTLLDSLDTTCN